MDDRLIAVRNKKHIQKFKAQLKKEFDMKRFGRSQKDFRHGDQSRQEYKHILAISVEMCSQDVGKIQYD